MRRATTRRAPAALVLDANQRSSLAVTRSLGPRGVSVYTADCTDRSLAGCSRWSSANLRCPSAEAAPSEFSAWVSTIVRELEVEVIFALTEVSSRTLLASEDAAVRKLLPFPDAATLELLADKARLLVLATSLGIPCPATTLYERGLDLRPHDLPAYPLVLKPTRSHVLVEGRWMPTGVRVVADKAELELLLATDPILAEHPVLVQEYVPGRGAGIFALYAHGQPVAFFAHRRLREKPPSGGVSVLSESVALAPELLGYAKQLLDRSAWHGVAMVEFRVTPEGRPYLMEVNARFWGSLQLAIDSGVDFPWLLWRVSHGSHPELVPTYQVGRRLRWLLGDLDHLYLSLRDAPAGQWAGRIAKLGEFLAPHPFRTRHEIDRWSDPRPAWFELKEYLRPWIRR